MQPLLALFFGFALFIFGAQRAYAATIIYVTPTGGGNGSSWANATTLQNALATAASGDEIWVKSGLYLPGASAPNTFSLKAGVAVYGGFVGTETLRSQRNWTSNPTVLSGDIDNNDVGKDANGVITTTTSLRGTNSYHVVHADTRQVLEDGSGGFLPPMPPMTSTTVLDGFIITAGNANGDIYFQGGGGFYCNATGAGRCSPHLENLIFSGNAGPFGGGIRNEATPSPIESGLGGVASPTLVNVLFTGNSAVDGGAMYNTYHTQIAFEGSDPLTTVSSPTLLNVTFTNNFASQNGGAIVNSATDGYSNPTLENVTFTNNSAGQDGGAMYNTSAGAGGGVSSPTLRNVTFTGNTASHGGAMANYSRNSDGSGLQVSSPSLVNVTFTNNSAVDGGAMYNVARDSSASKSNPTLVNVLFANNSASNDGGAMYNYATEWAESNAILVNVTFFGNSAGNYGPVMHNRGDCYFNGAECEPRTYVNPQLTNVIIWGNILANDNDREIHGFFTNPPITTSLLQHSLQGLPYTDGGGNVTGDPQFVNPTAGDFRLSFGSAAIDVGTNAAIGEVTDLNGDPRLVDSASSGTATVDMGAYEAPVYNSSFALTIMADGDGSGQVGRAPLGAACPSVCTARYLPGTVVTLTPTPNTNSSFVGWSGICTGTGPCVVTMDGDKSVTASFKDDTYTLALATVGGGEIINYNSSPKYTHGQQVTLYASPYDDNLFAGWSGDCTVINYLCQVTMDSNKSVTAAFILDAFLLTANIVGNGNVDKYPDQETYDYGTGVTLDATAADGYTFAGWSGVCTGTDEFCEVTIDENNIVTATFTQSVYPLTVNTVGSGNVSKQPNQATYLHGTVVTLTPNPATGFTFTGWSGACTGTGACSVTMDSAKSVTATFTQNTYALTVNTVGSGSVGKQPDQASYAHGTVVTLTPNPATGFTFTGWSGACTGTGACAVTMDSAKSVTATFTQNAYALTVNTVGSGSVNKQPDQASYAHGTVVTLTPNPATGFTFTGWSGACTGTSACAVTMDSAKSVTATFTQNTYALTVNTVGSGSVSKQPDQATYAQGTVVNVTTTADDGFTFSGWSGACTGAGDCSVTMDSAKSVTATFTQNQLNSFALTVTTVGGGTISKQPDQAIYPQGTVVTLTTTANTGFTFTGWSGACKGTGLCSVTMDSDKSVTATFTQISTPGNDAPGFTSTPGLNVTVDAAYTYSIVATDPDTGDIFTITAPTKPAWLTLTPAGSGTATLAGTPSSANLGDNVVQLRVQDAVGAFTTQEFTITVAVANPATTGTIQGTVLDAAGDPVEGALVTLTDGNGEVVVALVLAQLTDSNGDYRFVGVPLGNYTITVSIDGMAPSAPSAVTVQAGQTVTAPDIALQPSKTALHLPMITR